MANQVDQVTFLGNDGVSPPSSGTFTITTDPGGTHQGTTTALAVDAGKSDIQGALDASSGAGGGGDTVTLLLSDASGGFTNEYGGALANTGLNKWSFGTSQLFALAAPGGLGLHTQGVVPDPGIYTLTLGVAAGGGSGVLTLNTTINLNAGDSQATIQATVDAATTPGAWIVSGDLITSTGITFTKAVGGSIGSSPFSITANTLEDSGSTPINVSDGWQDGAAGTPVIFSLYVLDGSAGQASGGSFAIGSATGLAWNIQAADVATAISTATGQSFSYTSGAGTPSDPCLFTGPQADVTAPIPDWSGLTQVVIATTSTLVPGGAGGGPGGLSAMSGLSGMACVCV